MCLTHKSVTADIKTSTTERALQGSMQLARTRVLYFWFLCTVLYTNEKKLIARGNPIFKQLKTSGLLADLAYPQKTAAFLFKFPLYQM